MPTYLFRCPSCHSTFERLLRLVEYASPQKCACGEFAERQICAPAVRGDYPAYQCPITGRTIEGRAVRGLCGAYFVPHQDHMVLSACPQCDEVWEKLPR